MEEKKKYPKRGFASMSPEKRREIAILGGQKSSGNFKFSHERAVEMGRKGGAASKRNVHPKAS